MHNHPNLLFKNTVQTEMICRLHILVAEGTDRVAMDAFPQQIISGYSLTPQIISKSSSNS
jgi:hypothetical protein